MLPDAFVQTVLDVHGEKGATWLAGHPARLARFAERWTLEIGAPFALSYNYVAPATRSDGTPVVLKLGVPCDEIATEVAALQLYDGRGMARLLAVDEDEGALLLECVQPGAPLSALADDDEATRRAAQVMATLWRPLPADHPFPSVTKWAKALDRLRAAYGGGTGPLPAQWVDRAEGLFRELFATAAPDVLLHGDLHHYNILAARRSPWLAIDPKGVAGEPAYETGALLRNPVPQVVTWPDLPRIQARRVDILAEMLGFERERIVGYGVAQAVLSAVWSLEDHDDGGQPMLTIADALLRR